MDKLEMMYSEGVKLYRNRKFNDARALFMNLLNYKEYFYKALRMIIKINMRQNRFSEARQLILDNMYLNNFNTIELLSNLENVEYNYNEAISFILEAKRIKSRQGRLNVFLADYYINNGEFDKGIEALSLVQEGYFSEAEQLRIVMIKIILGDYDGALQELSKVNINTISTKLQNIYLKLYYSIMYFLGRIPKSFPSVEGYLHLNFKDLLFGPYDMLKGLDTYVTINKTPQPDYLYFSPSLDTSKFISSVRERISGMNPRFFNGIQIYNFNFDFPVGKLNDKDVYGASVKTPLKSSKIISILPADFSPEFDKEGLSTSEDLRKRLMIS